jgi:hypothetical protein
LDAILLHDTSDTIVADTKQGGQLALPQRIVLLVPLNDERGDLLVLEGTPGPQVQTAPGYIEGASYLAFAVRAIGSDQEAGQFHLLRRF